MVVDGLPTYEDVNAAARRLAGYVHLTPVVTSQFFDAAVGASIHFKCENLQKVGAFKFRGALNAVLTLGVDAAARGVVTHSSGNHGQALALAARQAGIPAWIVMPRDSAAVKLAAVRGYGAEVVFCEPGSANREQAARAVVQRTGAQFVHPYDDARVIAGQGTAARELLEATAGLDLVLTPVGGGGLLAGTALSVRALNPGAEILGAEPEAAGDAARSLATGTLVRIDNPVTVADGLRSAALGQRPWAIIGRDVAGILTVSEAEIVQAMRLVFERLKLVIEPSAAVPVAVLLRYKERFAGRRVGVILSGGNVDLSQLPWTA